MNSVKLLIISLSLAIISTSSNVASASYLDRFFNGFQEKKIEMPRPDPENRKGACVNRYECKDGIKKKNCQEKHGKEWSDKMTCEDLGFTPLT